MPASASASSAAWTKILDRVEQALTQALAELADRQRAVDLSPSSASLAFPWQKQLEQCNARLEQLPACVRQAEAEAAAVDAALEANEAGLRGWLTAAACLVKGSDAALSGTATRPRLAEPAPLEV